MISIFVMYSTDRKRQLDMTISCLEQMPMYGRCQKTLIVDGKIDVIPKNWDVIQVPRDNGKFSWGRVWDAGVYSARNENILYLDSDRLLGRRYLEMIQSALKDDMFLFTEKHFFVVQEMSLEDCQEFVNEPVENDPWSREKFMGKVKFEPRFIKAPQGPGKNVMSGNTAFTKRTYHKLGGVDHWYRGHGAFADTDFHKTAEVAGCQFVNLNVAELHLPHDKSENDEALDELFIMRLGMNNFIYYVHKWGLDAQLAVDLAKRLDIKNPERYVKNFIDRLPS